MLVRVLRPVRVDVDQDVSRQDVVGQNERIRMPPRCAAPTKKGTYQMPLLLFNAKSLVLLWNNVERYHRYLLGEQCSAGGRACAVLVAP